MGYIMFGQHPAHKQRRFGGQRHIEIAGMPPLGVFIMPLRDTVLILGVMFMLRFRIQRLVRHRHEIIGGPCLLVMTAIAARLTFPILSLMHE